MLSNDRKEIVLLHPIRTNHQLKKHAIHTQALIKMGQGQKSFAMSSDDFDSDFGDNMNNPVLPATGWGNWDSVNNQNIWDGVPFSIRRQFNSPTARVLVDLYIRFRLLFTKPTKNPAEMFAEMKENFKELENADITTDNIKELLTALEQRKQLSAVRELKTTEYVKNMEAKLLEAGMKQYQTEESMINFILQSPKGLCLTEIESFSKVIPNEVMDKFEKAEDLKVFDNYLILYYDPSGAKNQYYTEKPKPKDPILFGVIRNSTRLYYVADWIDDYCNLTYKDILKVNKDFKLDKKEK